VFLTFYSDGELLSIVTISGGLNKAYEALEKLKIKNFDIKVFEKLLTKKGVNELKYTNKEKVVLDTIKNEFLSLINIVNSQIAKAGLKYNTSDIDRIYVTSEYGNIEGFQDYIQKIVGIDTFSFEFYEEYNLDRLSVNPFLFLGMLEAHSAYGKQDQKYNFSLTLRKPTFFYRPSGRLFLMLIASIVGMGVYPTYLYFNGLSYENKNKELLNEVKKITVQNAKLKNQIKSLGNQEKDIIKAREKYIKDIAFTKNFITKIYKFKYSYIPKSGELVDITLIMNKDKVYLNELGYDKGEFTINVFSFKDTQIPNFIDDLVKKGFHVETEGVTYADKKYNAVIRIKE